jgi:hypothetical protein
MGATFTINDLGSTFSQVMEHQNKDITDIWTQSVDPLLAAFEAQSSNDGLGKAFITRVEYDTGVAANANFALAQALAESTDLGNAALRGYWSTNAAKVEAVAAWDRDSMLAAVGDGPGETFDVIARERKAKIAYVRHLLSIFAAERGWGRISSVSTINSGQAYFTVPLSEVSRFKKGMKIVFGATEATGTLRGSDGAGIQVGWGNAWTVSGSIPQSGRVTVSQRASDSATSPYDADAVRANDVVFLQGFRQNTASPVRQCPIGMKGWVDPSGVDAGETSFQGLDRRNTWQLSGITMDASAVGGSAADALIEAGMFAEQYDTEIDAFMISVYDYATLVRDKERVKTVALNIGPYSVGFDGVEVLGGKGKVKVVPSKYITQGTFWGGPFNSAEFGPMLKHNGELVNTDNADGNEFLRLATSTGFEQRLFFRGAMIIPGPGKYIVGYNFPTT